MKKYILVDPNDESGNDDGIRDEQMMTESEAAECNEKFWAEKSDLRWIKKH